MKLRRKKKFDGKKILLMIMSIILGNALGIIPSMLTGFANTAFIFIISLTYSIIIYIYAKKDIYAKRKIEDKSDNEGWGKI